MTEIEVAKTIIKQNGYCGYIECCDCPADRIYKEKGLESCIYLWDYNNDNKIKWFKNFLIEYKQSECKVIVNDNIEEKLDKIIKLLEDTKNEN